MWLYTLLGFCLVFICLFVIVLGIEPRTFKAGTLPLSFIPNLLLLFILRQGLTKIAQAGLDLVSLLS